MKALFLSESPLQLINAIEAKSYYNISDKDANIVLLKGVSNKSFRQQLSLINPTKWGAIYSLNYRFRSASVLKLMSEMRKVIKKNADADFVFIGDYRTIVMRHVINTIRPKRAVLLDDGNATIHLANDRYTCIRPEGIISKLKYYLLFKLLGIDDSYIRAVTFFTIYKIAPSSPDNVVQNNYTRLKSKLKNKPIKKEVIFLGCPFVETASLSINFCVEDYIHFLIYIREDISKRLDVDLITYVAHRREKPNKLELISSLEGFKVVDFDEPIEVALSRQDYKPLAIATFYSGAIDTLIKMMDRDVKFIAYRVPESDIDKDKLDIVNQYYDYYEIYNKSHGMEIIKLNK